MKIKSHRFILYLLLRIGMVSIRFLPRSVCLLLARTVGRFVYLALGRYRRMTLEHLRSAFGKAKSDSELKSIAQEVFVSLATDAVDWCKWPKLSKEERDSLISYKESDVRLLEDLLKRGKGVIAVTAHLGNWEILGAFLSQRVAPLTVLAKRIYYEPFNRTIVEMRKSWNVETVYTDDSPKKILKALHQNETVGILIDQDVERFGGIFVPFFGKLAFTPTAPIRIAFRSGAPVYIIFLIHESDKYRVVLVHVVCVEDKGGEEKTVEFYTKLCTQVFEKAIRLYPGQWVWMHNRWKTRPAEEVKGRRRSASPPPARGTATPPRAGTAFTSDRTVGSKDCPRFLQDCKNSGAAASSPRPKGGAPAAVEIPHLAAVAREA